MNLLRTYFTLCLGTMMLFGMIYPLSIWGIARLFPEKSQGNPVYRDGQLVGFAQIGQPFSSPSYFWGRPSAVNYDASATGGSNFGTSNPEHLKQVSDRIVAWKESHPGISTDQIPEDLVTASGSGLDPHISVAGARLQIQRVAKARKMDPKLLEELIEDQRIRPFAGFFGPGDLVNVLSVNLALDQLTSSIN
jgi:potassium-transporting ATPase KdpC subunit